MSTKKNPHAVALGRLGGRARATALTEARRKEIGRLAAKARWDKHRREKEGKK